MKASIFFTGLIFITFSCYSQEIKTDTAKADSIQLQKVYKMPMDTTHLPNSDSTHILRPDPFLSPLDSMLHPKTIDDADPKRPRK